MRAFLPKLKISFLSFFQNGFLSGSFAKRAWLSALLINIIMWIFILIKIRFGGKLIPLHFNAFYGIESVGPGFYFFLPPLIGFTLLAINFFLSYQVSAKDNFLSDFISAASVLLQLLLLTAVFNIAALI